MTRIGAIADVHLAPAGTPAQSWHGRLAFEHAEKRLGEAVARLEALAVDVIVLLGDVTHLGDGASLERALEIVRATKRPVRFVNGNHDAGEAADLLANALTGLAPFSLRCLSTQAEPIEGVLFAGVAVRLSGDDCLPVELPDVSGWPRDLVVLASHYPIISRSAELGARGIRDAGDLARGRQELERALRRREGPSLVLCGHLHVRDVHALGPVLQVAVPALIEDPPQIAVIETVGRRVSVRFHPIGDSTAGLQPSLCAAETSWEIGRDGSPRRRWVPVAPATALS